MILWTPGRALASLGLLGLVLLTSYMTGLLVLDLAGVGVRRRLEEELWALALGLGVLMHEVLLLGFIGLLKPVSIAVVLTLNLGLTAGMAGRRRRKSVIHPFPQTDWKSPRTLVLLFGGASLLLAVPVALAPPIGYDALMYHLEGPREFLTAGRITTSLSQWWLNYPFNMEMLFTIGLAFGLEAFAKLVHLSTGVLLVGATFALGDRLAGRTVGWLAAAAMLGAPILPAWAWLANVDLGWALFETLALLAIVAWWEEGDGTLLPLAGTFLGLAAGTKYLALPAIPFVVSLPWFHPRLANNRARGAVLARIALPAAVLALPWYLRNWLVLGDPLFPFMGGGLRLDPQRMVLFRKTASSYGGTVDMWTVVTLPLRVYLEPEAFSEMWPSASLPSTLFLLAPAGVVLWRDRLARLAGALALLRIILWASTNSVIRVSIPIWPLLALLAAYPLGRLTAVSYSGRPWRLFVTAVLTVTLSLSWLTQLRMFLNLRPLPVLVGKESPASYLFRNAPGSQALAHAEAMLPAGSRVLTTGDARLYLCPSRCIQSDNQFLWIKLALDSPTTADLLAHLGDLGVTHVVVSEIDIAYFEEHGLRDEIEVVRQRWTSLLAQCGRLLFSDYFSSVYQMSCAP